MAAMDLRPVADGDVHEQAAGLLPGQAVGKVGGDEFRPGRNSVKLPVVVDGREEKVRIGQPVDRLRGRRGCACPASRGRPGPVGLLHQRLARRVNHAVRVRRAGPVVHVFQR